MIKLRQAIIVEGKYDKIKLGQIFDAVIVATEGFGLFNDPEKLEYLRMLARTCGIIVFTDPDGAGLVIRNHIKSTIHEGEVLHAYIPDIPGKEKRKRIPGKEGLLGVEGVDDQLIIDAVMSCGIQEEREEREKVTKTDMYKLGFSGRKDSAERRQKLIRKMKLPSNISTNGLLDAINALFDLDEFLDFVLDLFSE
ncbi:MAG: DUF4093 domain-containing protein [Clostridia bacterium]|nr:DUF4093 domain-containing protein [Clostridia bacterium]